VIKWERANVRKRKFQKDVMWKGENVRKIKRECEKRKYKNERMWESEKEKMWERALVRKMKRNLRKFQKVDKANG
jgi:hypothetical protein